MQDEAETKKSAAEKRKKKRFKFPKIRLRFAIFWALILFGLAAFIVNQASYYADLRADIVDIQSRIAAEEAIIHSLGVQLAFFDSDAYIEQLARDRLGMVRPNEIVFRNTAD